MKRSNKAEQPVRISKRTSKPVREYTYHISDAELKVANKARSDAQIWILSDLEFRQSRTKTQQDNYYADPDAQDRRSLLQTELQNRPGRREAQAETTAASWERAVDRKKQENGIRAANQRPDVIAKNRARGRKRRKDMHDPIRGPWIMSRMLRSHKMSQPEKNLEFLLAILRLPFKFVGKGKLIIGLFCPDFFCEKKKAIIELFSYHHTLPENIERDKRRFALYNEEGYRWIVIDGMEMKDLRSVAKKIVYWYRSLN